MILIINIFKEFDILCILNTKLINRLVSDIDVVNGHGDNVTI
jgi:hypothetical protein